MPKTKQDKIEALAQFAQNPQLASFTEQQALTEALLELIDTIKSIELPKSPDTLKLPGVELVTLKGDKGEKGDKGDPGEPGEQGIPGQTGMDGANGRDGIDGRDGRDGVDGKDGKDGSPDTGEQIIQKINNAPTNLKIPASRIDGLPQPETTRIVGGGRPRVHYFDLSSQCDGATKTFNVPLNFGILGLFSTQAPIIYRPQIDWTEGNRTLTLTAEVSAPQAGQTLWCQYIK